MELVARGALALDTATEGRIRRHQVSILRDGARPGAPREQALDAIWNLYQRTPGRHHKGEQQGTRVEDLAKTAVKHYGSIARYVRQDVVPALVDRGLYERREGRILWIIPTTRYVLTPDGEAARDELQRLLSVGEHGVVGWTDNDPSRAMGYAAIAGAALLLQPDLFPHLQRARSTTGSDYGGGTYYGTTSTDDPSDVSLPFDFGGFDFGNLDLGDFGGFDAALSAIDSAIDAGGGDDGGGDSGGGDGGGGGDSGGGGE
jgi:hypothetical protein